MSPTTRCCRADCAFCSRAAATGSGMMRFSSLPRPLRGEVIRKTSMSVPVLDHGGITFTHYELHLPGEDKILNTDDDLIVYDGLVMTLTEYQSFVKTRNRRP